MLLRIGLLLSLSLSGVTARAQLTFPPPAASSPSIAGKPFTAEKHERNERKLADGTVSTHEFDVTEARTASGVIASVSRETGPTVASGASAPEVHVVIDTAARTLLQWTNLNRTATLLRLAPAAAFTGTSQTAKPEEFGHRVIQGYAVTGERTETQTKDPSSATPLRDVVVLWRSVALEAVLESTTTNPKTGTTVLTLVSVKPGIPDPALFHAPDGYTIHEIGPGSSLPHASLPVDEARLPSMSYDEAMAELDDPEEAHTAGLVLMKLERDDNDLQRKDKAVYALARKGLLLPAAVEAAESDVQAGEQALAHLEQPLPPTRDALRAEHQLARYWDTLGYALSRESRDGTRYLLAAWTVDPLAYYGSHLGHEYEQAHRTSEAIAIYRTALGAGGSAQMKQVVEDRLNALAGPASEPVAAAPVPQARAVASILYAAGQQPEIRFLSGENEVGGAGASTARKAADAWALPDAGPEQVVRLVAVTCAAGGCSTSNLAAHEP